MFDPSAPHIIILLVVVLLLFGSTRLPGAAKALGSSMNIFKKSLKEGAEEEHPASITPTHPAQATVLPPTTPAQPQAAPDATQQQLLDLQRQIQDLQRQSTASGAAPSGGVAAPPEAPSSQQQS
jgi:sec-independent protein translocase protein TatA